MQTAPDGAALSQRSVFFPRFSSPLLTPSAAQGTSAGSPGSCWSQTPWTPRGLAARKGCPCEGTPMGSLAPPGHGAVSLGWLCHQRAPRPALLSLFFPLLVSPLQRSPRGSSSSPQQLQGVVGKRAAPLSKSPAHLRQGQAGCWQGGTSSWAGARSRESPRHGENMPGVSGKPTSTLHSDRRPPLSWSLPMPVPEERVPRHRSASAGTKSRPRPASRWDSHRAQGNSGKPRDARTRHAHLFPLPFSLMGKESSLLSICSSRAQGSRGRGGQAHGSPTVPGPRGPGWELGAGSAWVSSPALLQPRRAGQGEEGGEGREEGSGEMKL